MTFETELVALRPGLMRTALKLVRTKWGAEDLVQEAMVRALACRHQFRAGTNLRAWVATIMYNEFFNQCRKQRHRKHHSLDDIAETEGPGEASVDAQMREVRDALAAMPAFLRLSVLQAAAGHTYEDMALMAGCALGTAKSRVHRGRTALREILEMAI